MLSERDVQDFQKLFRTETGLSLSDEEAKDYLENFTRFADILISISQNSL